MFTVNQYATMHGLVFRPDYAGYKPTVVEIPNGDGKADDGKRYGHIAFKYFRTSSDLALMGHFLHTAHWYAERVAEAVGLPKEFWPDIRYGALRVLDYPAGASSNRHCDQDLFTLMMYRDQPDRFKSFELPHPAMEKMRTINAQAHMGEMGELLGICPATLHQVLPSETRQQSIVYFAIPDHDATLPTGVTVRDWLNERMARSRTEFKKYE